MTEPTDGERAAFEAGIKFGALYHQFAGTPVSPDSADSLARAMEAAIENQPFCEAVAVDVHEDRLREAIGGGAPESDEPATGDEAPTAERADASDDATDATGDATDATDVAAYTELTGTLFDATVEVERAGHRVRATQATDGDYPLMSLAEVQRPE